MNIFVFFNQLKFRSVAAPVTSCAKNGGQFWRVGRSPEESRSVQHYAIRYQ